jgi:predicted ATP-dependent endonuclease of OLD family
MYLKTFQLKNFRRLKDVRVDLEEKETIFVGANNSGKTSATYAFRLFLGSGKKFKLYDFSSDCWEQFNRLATDKSLNAPEISLDLWFSVDDLNLHRVIGILPSLEWQGKPVGIRLCYKPKDVKRLIENFKAAREETRKKDKEREELTICDYLERALTEEYEIIYYVLDAEKFDPDTNAQLPDYEPHLIESANEGAKLINSLLRVDFLDAQRHLSDSGDSGRYENLSKRLGRYYKKNTEKPEVDPGAISAIRSSEEKINAHLTEAFEPLLTSLKELGYPGVSNPNPIIKSILNIEEILNSGTEVHYALPDDTEGAENTRTLPDQYNGLGFKNLIFMVIELLDFHSQWINTSEARPPIHLVMIEEPEAHLHIQLQQVFIRKLFELVGDAGEGFTSQFAVTTHSPHILYESNFKPIRYFSRKSTGASSLVTIVKDLSKFYESETESRDFLQRYLKLTHCDLFFSDGTILVEGNVERLIVPLIIAKDKHELTSCHLTLLEAGGAYAHKFEKLVEFLEIPTLIITDIDSVAPGATENEEAEDEDEDGDETTYKPGESCPTSHEGAVTSNEALKHWFPKKETIASLLLVGDADKIIAEKGKEGFIRIAYQTQNSIKWQSDTDDLVGRTLEEAFALENLAWIQDATQKSLGINIKDADKMGLSDLHLKIFKRVKSKSFDKTKFALGLIASDPDAWVSPHYIVDGLDWLYNKIEPEVLTVEKSDEAKAENV